MGRDIFGSGWSVDVVVHPGAGAYICGEETALLESLEGKRGFPRIKPPYFPAAIGLYGAPTIVNNVETVANLPWVVLNGGDAFAALGTGRSKGTKMIALSGDVHRPGNYELEFAKVTFRELIYDPRLGGGIRDGNELKCLIPGGVSSPWFGADKLDVTLANEDIADARLHGRLGRRHRDGQHPVHGAGRLAHHPVLPPRVLRAVHAVPRGQRMGGEDHARASRPATGASPTSTCSWTSATTSRPA